MLLPKSPIALALIATIAFGVASPLAKKSMMSGASPSSIGVLYGLFLIAIQLATSGIPQSASRAGWLFALAAGGFMAVGFTSINMAVFARGPLAVVMMIAALNPIISSGIGLTLLQEAKQVSLTRWVLGAALMFSGAALIINSRK